MLSLTGDRPIKKRDAKLLVKWWNGRTNRQFEMRLSETSRKSHRLYHVVEV